MEIQEAKFVGSFPTIQQCPEATRPEYAFIGRSNVGKSSLINMLSGRKDLAHVSKKPGKTEMINFFLVDEDWYLVDLPGYGFAKRAKSVKETFSGIIADYLMQRSTLQCAFVLLDPNVPAQTIDNEFVNWLGEEEIPFVIAYTKTDKLSARKLDENIATIQQVVGANWYELPQQFITSSIYKTGRDEMLGFIASVNKKFK